MSAPDTVYRGNRYTDHTGRDRVRVTADERPLTAERSKEVRFHSHDFEWGYGGAGPHQLALALVLDATGEKSLARKVSCWFMWAVVARLPDAWEVTAAEVRDWVRRCLHETCPAAALRVAVGAGSQEGGAR